MSATDVTRAGEVATEAEPADALTEPDGTRPPWTLRRVATLLAPAMIFLGVREFGLLVLTWMSATNGMTVAPRLASWDGEWFLTIADVGYDEAALRLFDARGIRASTNSLAFFPGYPTLVRWVSEAGGWLGIGLLAAALTVTVVSGVVCAYGLARLGRQIRGGSPRAGLVLVALFAASPMAIVLSMAYSEALFCALAVWALIGVLERRWVLAGTCCAFAGLVRPTAAALILAVGLAALVAVIQHREDWRPWLGGLLAPAGLVGYLAWVGARTGSWDGWFQLQRRGWDSSFDGGAATWTWVVDMLVSPRYPFDIITVAVIVAAVVLAVVCVVRRLEWPLLVYGLGVLAMNLTSDGLMNSKARLMVPAFTLLIPIALALAKRRTSTMMIVLCSVVVATSWLGAHSITSWGFAI